MFSTTTTNSFGKNFSSTDTNWLSSSNSTPFFQSTQQGNNTPTIFGVRTDSSQQENNKDKHNSSNRELIEKIINERQTDKLLLENIANDLTLLHQKLDILISRNNSQTLPTNNYVVCPLHHHVLKETDIMTVGSSYINGFTCDICHKTYSNKDEKIYQCSSCTSNLHQGKFDICTACIMSQLKK